MTTLSLPSTPKKKYYNCITRGFGYLNSVRDVPDKPGSTYLCCRIAALHGQPGAVRKCHFDFIVKGVETQELVRKCKFDLDENSRVLVGFRSGDPEPTPFIYESGPKKGELGANIKGRLFKIDWIKINGKVVFEAEPNAADGSLAEEVDDELLAGDPALPSSDADAKVPADAAA